MDSQTRWAIFLLVFIIAMYVGGLIMAVTSGIKESEEVNKNIVDCQSRGNDLSWCLDKFN